MIIIMKDNEIKIEKIWKYIKKENKSRNIGELETKKDKDDMIY